MSLPAVIATWPFGLPAVQHAGEILADGGDLLDAVEGGINVAELDAQVTSVGLGGFPNAEGIVELDAAIMDGRTHKAGSVAALRGIARPISVARRLLETGQQVMLVGEAAKQFALAHGFVEENLLTVNSRKKWQAWKKNRAAKSRQIFAIPHHDTIGLVAVNKAGNVAVGCSTSGLPFKAAGRVGDSPLLGSGLYVDNDVGGATATGVGEEIMKFCCSFLAVEFMRGGDAPAVACRKVIRRVLSKSPQDKKQMVAVIALDKAGRYGADSTRKGFSCAIWQAARSRLIQL